MATNLQIKSDPVPSSFCPINNADWTFLVGLLYAVQNGDPSINFGNSTPAPDFRDRPWVRTNSDGTFDGVYTFANGLWVRPHPDFVGKIVMYDGDVANITSLDGGTADPITTTTGAFWAKIDAADGKFPIQPGTMPSGAVIGAQATGGEELHTLVGQEIPKHTHPMFADEFVNPWKAISGSDPQVAKECNYDGLGAPSTYFMAGSSIEATLGNPASYGGANDGSTTPHNNLPPYYGAYLIKRTARQYYTQSP